MIVKELTRKVTRNDCITKLVQLHRKHYYEPGYILSSKRIAESYNSVYESLRNGDYIHTTDKITFQLENEMYTVNVGETLLREWITKNDNSIDCIRNMQIIPPEELDHMAVLLEVIFELTYYSFPETVENLV